MTHRERELFEELAAAFPDSKLFWRDEFGELVVREADDEGIDDALRLPASTGSATEEPRTDQGQLRLPADDPKEVTDD